MLSWATNLSPRTGNTLGRRSDSMRNVWWLLIDVLVFKVLMATHLRHFSFDFLSTNESSGVKDAGKTIRCSHWVWVQCINAFEYPLRKTTKQIQFKTMCVDVNPFVAYWQVFDLFGLVYVKILDVGFNSGFFQDGWVIFETGLCALMLFELTLKVNDHFCHPMKKWRICFFCGSSRRLILRNMKTTIEAS